jgi:type VI secretion system protein ImpH
MKRLLAWVRNYAGTALDWDVRLILTKEETPPLRLGGRAGNGLRLGWSTWPAGATPGRNPDQLLINPSAHAG